MSRMGATTPMQKTIQDTMRLMTRRTRSGQSIIIIALGFIVLIAFVGIATDAALLFVRFSTLRRAVDAAAVAAAGQIRENTSYAQVAAAAEQYIKLHGLNPGQVLVETCETDIDNLKKQYPGTYDSGTQAIDYLVALQNGVPRSELCRKDPAKLVRVTALIESPTTFLSVIGYQRITLAASSISQTAVMDVVLMLDSSLSMSYDTGQLVVAKGSKFGDKTTIDTYLNSAVPGFHTGALDPTIASETPGGFTLGLSPYNATGDVLIRDGTNDVVRRYYQRKNTGADGSVRGECRQGDPGTNATAGADFDANNEYDEDKGEFLVLANYGWAGCCNDPTRQIRPEEKGPSVEAVYGRAGLDGDPVVNKNDINWFIDARTGVIHVDKSPVLDANGIVSRAEFGDGTADKNFSDLICRPFKDVRDATRRFLLKVDFTRGDRVIMIQFDAAARAMTRNGVYQETGTTAPIFTTKSDAINALNRYVGVEVNPSGLGTTCATLYNSAHSWNNITAPHPIDTKYQVSIEPYHRSEYFYETIASCPDTNTGAAIQSAASLLADPRWIRRDSVWIAVLLSDGYPNRTPGVGVPNVYNGLGGKAYADGSGTETWNPNIHIIPTSSTVPYGGPTNLSTGSFFDPGGIALPATITDPGFCPWRTICDSTEGSASSLSYLASNIAGNGPGTFKTYESITGTVTREGQNQFDNLPGPDGYNYFSSNEWWSKYCTASDREPIWWDFYKYAITNGDTNWHEGGNNLSARRPLCADNNPDTRHFCVDPTSGSIVPGSYGNLCSDSYDADDFARDRVDFAALIDYTPKLKGNFIAMFSIFFPHTTLDINNSVAESSYLRENILGVKFMRYVADAGDNGIIDNPLQSWYRDQAYKGTYNKDPLPPSGSLVSDTAAWNSTGLPSQYLKTKDPCFDYDFRERGLLPKWDSALKGENPDNLAYEALAKQTCGNYYYAGNATAVDRAFTDIASRLFTRLSR